MKSKISFSASLRLCGFVFLIGLCSLLTTNAQTIDYTRYVNPFIGTGGHGHTFPGATVPFGMVQLSPDTRIDNWDGSSGYHYSDDVIYGFSHTHLSGTGIPDGCDILLMPTTEPGLSDSQMSVSKFSHANEIAEPGYYSVKLDNSGIFAELTATTRVGLHRYTFPQNGTANIILDLKWRDQVLDSDIEIVGNRVEGFRRSRSWAKDQTIYFVAEFSKPSKYKLMVVDDKSNRKEPITRPDGRETRQNIKAAVRYDTKPGEQILVKVAISYVSIEGARKNLEAEIPGWDFDKVRRDAKAAWNKELSKIEVSGGTPEQMTTFYSALYHTAIQPNVFNDVDGKYRGHDDKIHQLPGYTGQKPARSKGVFSQDSENRKSEQYTVFSLWDTFRAAHPLYTIIDEKRTADFINSFIRMYEQGGRLPVWELWGEETDTMIGYHAVSVIADAMAKGIKGFDYEKAFEAAKHSAELDHFGLAAYKKRGYISMEDENESVSKTLEYAYDDWCIAQMAEILQRQYPKNKTYQMDNEKFSRRAAYFQNLFDPSTGFMRPKKNGGFVSPFAPNEVTFNFTEGNSWVYSFFVPQDVSRLMTLYGGREKFAAKLDELFTTADKLTGRDQPDITGLIGQYAHGNEPSHHIAYLYDYTGEPWKTQQRVRQILDDFYHPTPDGLIGNEDCGQMSAWYILSASGFYPVAPGSPVYAFGTPLFPEMTYRLENGRTFTIRAKNVSRANKYILKASLNGAPYKKAFIDHADIMKGGILEFSMTDMPVTTAFTGFPVSSIKTDTPPVPIIDGGGRVFEGQSTVAIKTLDGAKVLFRDSRAGTSWQPYTKPLAINTTTTIYAKSVSQDGKESPVVDAAFVKKPNNWTVSIASKYNRQYTGGGDEGLIDGIRGSVNFSSGEWQGYQPQDFIATVDLQKITEIKRVGAGFLQNARSWIWMPTHVVFEVSADNQTWVKVADIASDVKPDDMTPQIKDLAKDITPVSARYVRVHAFNLGKIPAWHPGAGFDSFIFVDEILVN